MKSEPIVKQMSQVIPGLTNIFSAMVTVQTSSYAATGGGTPGGVVSVQADGHDLSTNDEVRVVGNSKFPIVSATFLDGIVTITTSIDHDLITNDPAFPNVIIEGVSISDYNGTFPLLSTAEVGVPNRRTFKYRIETIPAGSGTGGNLIDPQQLAYGVLVQVTVIDDDNFTYPISVDPRGEPNLTIISTGIRISRGATIERCVLSYTEQADGELWAFVVLNDKSTSKDRDILNDATNTQPRGQALLYRRIEPFSIYILAPNTNQIAGAINMDLMEDVEKYLTKAVVGFIPDTVFKCKAESGITPLGSGYFGTAADGDEAAGPGVYIHRFQYERVVDIRRPDTVEPVQSHAYRDTEVEQTNDFNVVHFQWSQDQDEQPIP